MVNQDAYSPRSRARLILSVLQSTLYLSDVLGPLSTAEMSALQQRISALMTDPLPDDVAQKVIDVVAQAVSGFGAAWERLAADGHTRSRLSIINTLARGQYTSGSGP